MATWLAPFMLYAATEGRILSENDIDPAEGDKLSGELAVFESVGQGIRLSLAACADTAGCEPVLSEDELATLIQTLENRIDQLNAVDDSADTGAGYDSLIDEYRQTREAYALYMRELQDIRRGVREFAEEEMPAESPADEQTPSPPPEPEQSARATPPEPEARPEPAFENEDFDIESFEDVDEPIRSY